MKIGSHRVGFRRNKFGRLVLRLGKDEKGAQMVEIALGIALMAALAGFGLVFLGNALGFFFEQTAGSIGPASVPTQQTPGGTGPSNVGGGTGTATPPPA